MKFRSLHKWTLGNTTDGLLFFAQRLDELLFDFSLDSFKPPALNPPFLCVEALSLIDDIEAGVIEATNLNHVLEELIWSVQRDTVSKKLLDVKIESHVLLHEVPLAQKRIRLEVLSKTLNSTRYIEKCNELTKEAIAKCCKKDIDKYARSLVTCLINIGLSKTFLYRQVKEYFFQGDVPKITGANDVDGFLEKIYPTVHAFEVYFIVSGQIRTVHKSINGFGIEIMENVPSALSEFATLHGFSKKEDQVFVHVSDINAFDAHAARAEAERRIETLKDLFTLFFHRNSLYWETKTLISQCCSDRLEVIGRRRSSMEKSFDMNPVYAAKRLNWMLDNFALKFGGSFDKFNRIVDLHGICVSNEVPENQLLNLWISLETLVPSNATKNKINNITNSLDPFICRSYIRRQIDYALLDLLLWNPGKVKKLLRKVPNTKGQKAAIKLLHLLVLQDNEDLRKELYGECKDFHLLRFRLFSLAETLKEPKMVTNMLENHSKKVSWQLRRLYRTRNLLVHAGRTPSYLSTLIENGHDYLDLVLNEVLEHSCSEYRVETIEQAFELERLLMEQFSEALDNSSTFTFENVGVLYQ